MRKSCDVKQNIERSGLPDLCVYLDPKCCCLPCTHLAAGVYRSTSPYILAMQVVSMTLLQTSTWHALSSSVNSSTLPRSPEN